MFATIAASAVVLLASTTQDPEPRENQWVCSASAEAWNGASVSVFDSRAANGSRVSFFSHWEPPRTGEIRPAAVNLRTPRLSLYYDAPEQALAPSGVMANMSTEGGSPRLLEGLKLWLFIDGDGPLKATNPFSPDEALEQEEEHSFADGLTHRSVYGRFDEAGVAERLTNARSARLVIVDADGRSLAETLYDVGAREQRDQLFAEARVKLLEAVRNPTDCGPTVGNTDAS